MRRTPSLALAAVLLATAPALAGDGTVDFSFDLGGGALVKPEFEGARSYGVGPFPIFVLHHFDLGALRLGGPRRDGFTFRPSVNVVGRRDDDMAAHLRGMGDVDTAVELGAVVGWRFDAFHLFVDARRGFGGHEGVVGTVGLDVTAEPVTNVTVEAGPRLGFASDDYMATYFGVTPAQAAASGLAVHDAGAGVKSAGVAATVRWRFADRWTLVGGLGYDRLLGDAADSPVVTAGGSADQFQARLGLSYRFDLDW